MLCLPVAAWAQRPEQVRRAQALSDEARDAYAAGRYAEAAEAYLAAHELVDEPVLLKNAVKILAVHVGDCDRTLALGDRFLATGPEPARAEEVAGYQADCLLGRADRSLAAGAPDEARSHLRRAAALPLPAPARARLEAAVARVEAEARRPVAVAVAVEAADGTPLRDFRVEIDGAPATLREGRVEVPRGAHTLLVRAEGHEPARVSFEAAPEAAVRVRLSPRAAAPAPIAPVRATAPPAGPDWRFWAGCGAAGVAVAAGIAAVVVDVGGQSTVDDLESVAAEGRDRARYDQLLADAEDARLWSGVLYGTAAVAAAAGAALLVWSLTDDAEVAVAPQGAGLSIGGRW